MDIPIATRTRVEYGIELPWERVERYGPQWMEGSKSWTDHPPKGTVKDSGTAFIELYVLEELIEADHSYGMGGAYIVGGMAGNALEKADLATQETRGGYYTTEDQKVKLRELVDSLYEQMEKLR